LSISAIEYALDQPGKVSLAIYDAAGRQVRTLLNASPQSAGKQSLLWDGLDRDGKPVSAGEYGWKLLQSPGVKAEYLFSLGTSVGIQHWVGQHGGPNTLAIDGDSVIVGGSPEGSPLMCKIRLDGAYVWPTSSVEPSGGLLGIAVDAGNLYGVMGSGHLYIFSGKTGVKTAGPVPLLMPVKKFDPIPLNSEHEKILALPVAEGRYLLRAKLGDAVEPTGSVNIDLQDRTATFEGASAGKFHGGIGPEVYRIISPVAVREGKLTVRVAPAAPGERWAVPELELLCVAGRIAARQGELAACFREADAVAWIDPATGKVLDRVQVPAASDIALIAPGEALAISGDQVLRVSRTGKQAAPLISGLIAPQCLTVDPKSGDVLVAEGGDSQQVKRFDKQGKLRAAHGRPGGRRPGLYKPEDFLSIASIVADGTGGFIICESQSAPRRTARFNSGGKLMQEWYGGQQFYTFAAPEPGKPNLVWMDSQWNWMMQAEVDYEKRTWKVRACYNWNQELDQRMVSGNKMASRMFPMHADLDNDGQQETYLWLGSLLLKVDEQAGKLQPVAALGNFRAGSVAEADWPPAWVEAVKQRVRPGFGPRNYTGFGWADANGDFKMQAAELTLLEKDGHGFQGGPNCTWIDEQFRIHAVAPNPEQPAYEIRQPTGRTASGTPIWDWNSKATSGPVMPYRESRQLREADDGSLYQLLSGNGDGYSGGLDSFHGHGPGWPGTMADRAAIVKYGPQGDVLWQVGSHAGRSEAPAGQVHFPTGIAGFAKGCVGITDYFEKPCYFWTSDGLYVGELLDGRVSDGLPDRVYSWWRADKRKGDEFDNLAAFQYDMLVGGSLAQLANGDVVFLGAGWNNVPVFRVHGLDQLQRQQGSVQVTHEPAAAAAKGAGLRGEYFANPNLEPPGKGDALDDVLDQKQGGDSESKPADFTDHAKRLDPRLWLGDSRHAWPEGSIVSRPFSVRWTGQIEPRFSEPYTFALYLRGKGRLLIDGKPVLEKWDRPATNEKVFSKPIVLQAGRKHAIAVEFSRAGVDKPELHLCWESPSQTIEHVPTSALYALKEEKTSAKAAAD